MILFALFTLIIGFVCGVLASRQAVEIANREAQRADLEAIEQRRQVEATQRLNAKLYATLILQRRQHAVLGMALGQAGYAAPPVFLN